MPTFASPRDFQVAESANRLPILPVCLCVRLAGNICTSVEKNMQETFIHSWYSHIDPRIRQLALVKSWLQTRRPPCGCENWAASTSSVSVCLIHPDTDTFYSGWDQHFLWHLTLSHTNVTNPSCARPNSSAGNSRESGRATLLGWVNTTRPRSAG